MTQTVGEAVSVELTPSDTWQTQARGDNESEYQIYVANAQSLGWPVKSYDEWLAS